MPRIVQLSSEVITRISAGEVIERPASVVKELVENSVDAGATRIDIEIDQGGVERIAVYDDGCGIEPDELPLALASHATSKLRDADDLFRVGTFGFRGEALASVGGVAHVTIQSRPTTADAGAEIGTRGGQLSPLRPWNGAPGTRIEVKHLFFNTPVRRKFLKATGTEFGHVSEAVTRLALAYPSLHFTLKHNGKLVHDLPATPTLPDRLQLFFGPEVRNTLFEVTREQGTLRLHGYIADPVLDRGNARLQYLFLNGRWFRDRGLSHAIQEGFRGLLMTGRYAVAFLFIEMPPDHVDVNVHPTKAEVRFRDPSSLFHLVLSAIRSRLNEANLVPRLQPPSSAEFGIRNSELQNASSAEFGIRNSELQNDVLPPPEYVAATFAAERREESPEFRIPNSEFRIGSTQERALQIHDSYLVLETSEGMLVIDQHALHERILFEQFKKRLSVGPMERQRLLIPEPVDLTPEQAGRVLEARAELAELGLEVEDFGGGTVLVQSYPTLLNRLTPVAILREAVEFLGSQDRVPPREVLLNDLMSTMACKAAVKAGDRLTPEQIAALLEQRHLARDAHHCPHGRPTSLMFSRKELDRQFGRI